MTGTTSTAAASLRGGLYDLIPGIVVSGAISAVAYFAAPVVSRVVPLPAMVIALLIGMVLKPFFAARPSVQPGMAFCVRTVLRWAVALLGLRIALANIAGSASALLARCRRSAGGTSRR